MPLDTDIIPRQLKTYSATWAARPTTDLSTGDLFYATDRKTVYRWDGSSWSALTVYSSSGTDTSKPTASDLPAGSLYYATDTYTLYQGNGSAWIAVQTAKAALPKTQVFNSNAPTGSFTDLDLSAVVGAAQALVLLAVYHDSGTGKVYSFRENGESYLLDNMNSSSYWNWSAAQCRMINTTRMAYIVVMTDSNGIVEWICDNASTATKVSVMAYVK